MRSGLSATALDEVLMPADRIAVLRGGALVGEFDVDLARRHRS